jgi:threonyl-tRNA synthetase
VVDKEGRPVAGAEVDVWHASPVGLYENQDPEQADMNLRGKFLTDADGRFSFRSVMFVGYPIPTDGVVGRALKAIPRDQVVIATKAQFRGKPFAPPEKVVAALDNSLRLMGTDYVDVFNLHGVEIDEYGYAIERMAPALLEQKVKGKMAELAQKDEPVVRRLMARDDAVAYFKSLGEHYKAEIIASIPSQEDISLYAEGAFTDLCRGPHVPSTGKLKVFKLMKVAGAYWRGDSKNEMLQRIYGTAWAKKEDQEAYLHRLEEAEKRDHRKLGRSLDLFHTQDEAPGMVFWHPKGWAVWQQIEQYMRGVQRDNGYLEVKAPSVLDVSLWKRSGHWDNFRENMFFTESESRQYAVKPMNCPGHVQIFNQGLKSYRDLPLRFAEFGSCHRNEPSGALHGIMRVRGFTQDDAHIFCTPEQVEEEVVNCLQFAIDTLSAYGFEKYDAELSTWDGGASGKYDGSPEQWAMAEGALQRACDKLKVVAKVIPDEAAFYGPKIDVKLVDAIGRKWQLSTVQFDFTLPRRFGLEYIAEDGKAHQPLMVHRALYGSIERFFGILIEHYAGAFPLWLAPVQVEVCPVSEKVADYSKHVTETLKRHNLRVHLDNRNEKLPAKIRDAQMQKIPYMLVVGAKEAEAGTVSVRHRSKGDLGPKPLAEVIESLQREVESRATS